MIKASIRVGGGKWNGSKVFNSGEVSLFVIQRRYVIGTSSTSNSVITTIIVLYKLFTINFLKLKNVQDISRWELQTKNI